MNPNLATIWFSCFTLVRTCDSWRRWDCWVFAFSWSWRSINCRRRRWLARGGVGEDGAYYNSLATLTISDCYRCSGHYCNLFRYVRSCILHYCIDDCEVDPPLLTVKSSWLHIYYDAFPNFSRTPTFHKTHIPPSNRKQKNATPCLWYSPSDDNLHTKSGHPQCSSFILLSLIVYCFALVFDFAFYSFSFSSFCYWSLTYINTLIVVIITCVDIASIAFMLIILWYSISFLINHKISVIFTFQSITYCPFLSSGVIWDRPDFSIGLIIGSNFRGSWLVS